MAEEAKAEKTEDAAGAATEEVAKKRASPKRKAATRKGVQPIFVKSKRKNANAVGQAGLECSHSATLAAAAAQGPNHTSFPFECASNGLRRTRMELWSETKTKEKMQGKKEKEKADNSLLAQLCSLPRSLILRI